MWLLLCDDRDVSARWIYEGFRKRSVSAELVLTSTLSRAVRWLHQLDSDGARVEVLLPDGRRIASEAVTGTINRLSGVPLTPSFAGPDGEYAHQELLAMYLSFLYCLPAPMLNRPTPQGLAGRMRYSPDWLVLAARAGFGTPTYVASSQEPTGNSPNLDSRVIRIPPTAKRQSVIVAAGQVFGTPVNAQAAAAARRLAGLADMGLLGLRIATTVDGVWFESAELYPDLRTAGSELIEHLAALSPGDTFP